MDDRGGVAERDGDARDQAAQDAVSDDEAGGARHRHRMVRGRSEGEQRHLGIGGGDGVQALGRCDHRLRSATEERPDVAVAARAGDEDSIADLAGRVGADLDHGADGLVARHQRVAHAREGRHLARPEKALGAGADRGVGDLDAGVALAKIRQPDRLDRDLSRLSQNDG